MEERAKIIILLVILSGVIAYLCTDTIDYKIALIVYIIAAGDFFYKMDIMYPFVWLSPFLFLYGTAVLFLDLLGVRDSAYPGIIIDCTFYSIISLFIWCLCFIRHKKHHKLLHGFLRGINIDKFYKLLLILGFLLFLYIPAFLRSGYTSKMETNLNGGLLGYGIVSRLFILVYIVYSIYYICLNDKLNLLVTSLALFVSLLISLFLGERDVFFSIALCSFLVYCYFFKPKLKFIILFASIGIILVPILGMTKQITNQENLEIQQNAVFEGIFEGEFLSSGRNIETLLINKNTWRYQYGEAFYNDVIRSIIPPSISNVQNSTGWYNSKYNSRIDEGYGAGFSYVGEGYLQGGVLGIIIWMLLLTLIIKVLYDKSHKSIYGLSAYVFMICLIIYALRGDLSYVLSPLLKQVLLGYILLVYYCKLFGHKNIQLIRKT